MNSGVVRWHPPMDADVIHRHTALGEQLLDIAVGEAVAQIPAHRYRDHLTTGSKQTPRTCQTQSLDQSACADQWLNVTSPRPRSTRFADRLCPYSRGRVGACIRGGALALRHLGVLRSAGVKHSVDDGARWQTVRRSPKARTGGPIEDVQPAFAPGGCQLGCQKTTPGALPQGRTPR